MSVSLKGLVVGNLEEYCEFENGQKLPSLMRQERICQINLSSIISSSNQCDVSRLYHHSVEPGM